MYLKFSETTMQVFQMPSTLKFTRMQQPDNTHPARRRGLFNPGRSRLMASAASEYVFLEPLHYSYEWLCNLC
ncbi:hypothetical protein EB105725_05_00890 [Shimwellia blattae DSM 4481 = NBRC 105725]|nr:hypothetical protein EB105725_05_00890 [Shimwellia blattae DSM 4481 = NBRC 105725]